MTEEEVQIILEMDKNNEISLVDKKISVLTKHNGVNVLYLKSFYFRNNRSTFGTVIKFLSLDKQNVYLIPASEITCMAILSEEKEDKTPSGLPGMDA